MKSVLLFPIATGLLALSQVLPVSEAAGVSPQRANIIFILADDVSPELFSSYGSLDAAKTPNIDRIAAEGARFQTCFAPASCGPSRALLMTGVYGNRTGVFANNVWAFNAKRKLFKRHESWAKTLREAGYATAIAGKWHCSGSAAWSEEVGFEEYCLWESPKRLEQRLGIPAETFGTRTDRYWDSPMIQNGEPLITDEGTYGPDVRCDFLLDFMDRKVEENRPFVAYWPTVLAHGPYAPTPTELADEPRRKSGRSFSNQYTLSHLPNPEREVRGMLEYLDLLIGRLVRKTEELGIADSTYILFGSDNGSVNIAKNRGIEEGVRVPYLIKGPGILPHGATNELTDYADIAPTLLEIAGVEPSPGLDGKSQLPFLTGKTKTHRDWIYSYAGPVQVVRTRRYLLEAKSELLGNPAGRFYFTGKSRRRFEYLPVDRNPVHFEARAEIATILASLPQHLDSNHPFWTTADGKEWMEEADLNLLAEKQLHPSQALPTFSNTPTRPALVATLPLPE